MEINFDEVNRLVSEGYISCRPHPMASLRIFNYTVKAQFNWHWTPETMSCRGLITDKQDNIVARPFQKFFSYEQLNGDVPSEPFEVYEKLDGSLGVLYFIGDYPYIATRGSFDSEQAIRATELLRQRYSHVSFDPRLTYLFEIIYPDNRIVVDYGKTEDLFLLAIIDTQTGVEMPLADIGIPVVKRYDGINDLAELRQMNKENAEGFVIKFKSGQRVKMKFEEYKRLHKLLTGINARHIWELMAAGQSIDPILERVPDEFYDWVKQTEFDLSSKYNAIENQAKFEFRDLGDRKTNATYYQQCAHPAVMFKLLDKRDYADIIWKQIKPKGELPFKCNFEET